MIQLANSPEFASMPPAQIVAILAERGQYVASESSFYRVLKANQMLHHRGKAREPAKRPSCATLLACAVGDVWTWDVTYLPTDINGKFFKLYMIIDLYSRKVVGWEVFEQENSQNSETVLQKAILAEGGPPDALHSDNGSPFKNANLHAMMLRQEITPSHSRPRVSNDNAFSESLFRTVKYHPSLPEKPFESLETARDWVKAFVCWYNQEHRHKGIGMVTPDQKHAGEDLAILEQRRTTYQAAKAKHPGRWIKGKTRGWDPVAYTALNPPSAREIERALKKAA